MTPQNYKIVSIGVTYKYSLTSAIGVGKYRSVFMSIKLANTVKYYSAQSTYQSNYSVKKCTNLKGVLARAPRNKQI